MKPLSLFLALMLTGSLAAKNDVTSVTQVTTAVDVTGDTDYTITSTEPFGASNTGSVNIVDTEHAVVILKNIKPSKVLSAWMDNIYIKGEKAVDGTNCIVQMYCRGAIIFPYANSDKPLTCYSEENFGGTAYDSYGTGNTGGYMNTLTTKTGNNNIRSFKLKRGYMVTFAVGTGGWGYSRCFIADQEDLEISSVPAPLNGKISSYRLFHWYNAHKAGGASSGDATFNAAINSSWCYDWGQGNASLLPDVEWVPNHIYEDWPSSATCGSVTGSCHMKTNNEPGNSADDHPQTVDEVLANWQNLMRTGMRLCSESSHDGSMSHLKSFIDSIDARGWRCDLLDLHCYWPSGSFDNLTWYSNYYGNGRPIWISEWLWGASWNSNGAFASGAQSTDATYNGTVPILQKLNANTRVERYAMWNGEQWYTRLYNDNALTKIGQYYATMDVALGYNPDDEFIPRIVYTAPGTLTGTFTKKNKTEELAWTDPNGDMLDSIVVECKLPGSSKWTKVGNVKPKDKTSSEGNSYTYTDTLSSPGIYYYRISEYYDDGKKFTTNEVNVTLSAANSAGQIRFGQLKIASTDAVSTDIETMNKIPYVVMGMISNKNSSNGITNQINTLSKSSFKYRMYPWALNTPVEIKNSETIDYLVLPPDTIMHLSDDVTIISQKGGNVKGDEVQITFPEPFPEGITPIVVAQQNTSVTSYAPVTVKVYNITNEGFTTKLVRQEGVTASFNAQNVNYFACSPGQASIGNGKMITAGRNTDTPCGGSSRQTIYFKNENGDTLHLLNPYIIAAPQTNNYAKASIFRMHSTTSNNEGTYCMSVRRQVDETSTVTESNVAKNNGDYVGWIVISDNPNGDEDDNPTDQPDGIIQTSAKNHAFSVTVQNRYIQTDGANVKVYNASGSLVNTNAKLPVGLYFVTNGKTSRKVIVR